MKIFGTLIFASLLLLATPASAGIRPSFFLDHCAWHSTHVLIATEGDEVDGKLTVLESLKGDLRPGEPVSVPELASFKSKSARLVKIPFYEKNDGPPKYVTGARMILFLKRRGDSVAAGDQGGRRTAPPPAWGPASFEGEMNVSVLWLEGDESYAFIQVMNPGPSILTLYGRSEGEIRGRTSEILRQQESLNRALAVRDKSQRAQALEQFARSDFYLARDLALTELRKCGSAALPVLRNMLSDPALLGAHGEIIKTMTAAGGSAVGQELTAIVREELEFWKAKGPRLKVGWWSELDEPEREELRDRYIKVFEAIHSLRELKFTPSREVITEFRDFWRSLPQLEDRRGLSQMSEACDALLRGLQ